MSRVTPRHGCAALIVSAMTASGCSGAEPLSAELADGAADSTLPKQNDDATASSNDGVPARVDGRDAASPAVSPSVLQFHRNPSRDGVYVDSRLTPAAVASMRTRMSIPLDGQVCAQPLYFNNGPQPPQPSLPATQTHPLT